MRKAEGLIVEKEECRMKFSDMIDEIGAQQPY